MHVGLLGLALPVTILGTNFSEIYHLRQEYKKLQTQQSTLPKALATLSKSMTMNQNDDNDTTDNQVTKMPTDSIVSANVCTLHVLCVESKICTQ